MKYKYDTSDFYHIDSILFYNITEMNYDVVSVQRFVNQLNHNFYYFVRKDDESYLIRLYKDGIFWYNFNAVKSYSYLSSHLGSFLSDTLRELENWISHEAYISVSGVISDRRFKKTIKYRQIEHCSVIAEYISLLERDLLNLLEYERACIYQLPLTKNIKRDEEIVAFIKLCTALPDQPKGDAE